MIWSFHSRACVAAFSALLLTGCGSGLDYYDGPPPEMDLRSPEVWLDSTAIVFAFKFRSYPYMLATVSTSPADPDVFVLETPPGLNLLMPTVSPDDDWIAMVSFCEGGDCYEGANGYNVWRARIDGSAMERMSPVQHGVRRREPVFGTSGDEIYYIESSTALDSVTRLDIAERFLMRVRHGHVQEVLPGPLETIEFMKLRINASVARDRWLFVGMADPESDHPFVDELNEHGFKYQEAMFSFSEGSFRLEKPFQVIDADVSRREAAYVYVRGVYPDVGGLRYDFHLVDGAEDRFLFHYAGGHVLDVSISDDLRHVVFRGQRRFDGPWAIWHYDMEAGVLTDLQVPERLTEKVMRLIDEERGFESAALPAKPQ